VAEAKNYLNSQGMTNQEISEMIAEENGDELDLVPLVMSLQSAEKENTTAGNFSGLFLKNAYAQSGSEIVGCAVTAIGADLLFSIGAEALEDGQKNGQKKLLKKLSKVLHKEL